MLPSQSRDQSRHPLARHTMHIMKPTVFLSHASIDEAPLRALKKKLVEKTNSSINFFLASDGQSIPVGRNWVHKIEEELKGSHVMFVFVSPSSIASQWVFFEAGFAYARGIKVIPVGLLGIDLAELPPPLGLLQGFNIRDVEGLNNIVAILNVEFELTAPVSFSREDFGEIFGAIAGSGAGALGRFAEYVADLTLMMPCDDAQAALQSVANLALTRNLPAEVQSSHMTTSGVQFNDSGGRHEYLTAQFAPELLSITFPLAEDFVRMMAIPQGKLYDIYISFTERVSCLLKPQNLTARLYGTPVELRGYYGLRFRGSDFTVAGSPATLHLRSANQELSELALDQLIDILFDRKVLSISR